MINRIGYYSWQINEWATVDTNPANIRLDEDVLKTSWRRLSSSSSEDVFKTSQDVFKTSSRRFEGVFKTSSRHLTEMCSKRLQNVFKTFCKDVFKTFLRPIIRLNCLPRSYFWEIYGQYRKFASVIKISQVLVFHFTTSYRGAFRTWPNIYKGAFFCKNT